jgi:hypothetical protein
MVTLLFCEELARALGAPPLIPSENLARLPAAVQRALQRGRQLPLDRDIVAWVMTAPLSELCRSESWKWREALWEVPPQAFDALAFAHGPLQALDRSPGTILWFGSNAPAQEDLRERLSQCLEEPRHRLVSIEVRQSGTLGLFEVDAVLTQVVLRLMRQRNLNPNDWPARGRDRALYELGR